jgi:hypothetical protein
MSVLTSVVEALDVAGVAGWRREIVEALASSMDESPNASTAKELKVLMAELVEGEVVRVGDISDDLTSKREDRRRASSS